jgi:hypothetical protein
MFRAVNRLCMSPIGFQCQASVPCVLRPLSIPCLVFPCGEPAARVSRRGYPGEAPLTCVLRPQYTHLAILFSLRQTPTVCLAKGVPWRGPNHVCTAFSIYKPGHSIFHTAKLLRVSREGGTLARPQSRETIGECSRASSFHGYVLPPRCNASGLLTWSPNKIYYITGLEPHASWMIQLFHDNQLSHDGL